MVEYIEPKTIRSDDDLSCQTNSYAIKGLVKTSCEYYKKEQNVRPRKTFVHLRNTNEDIFDEI